jgi:cellulose synthase/poly-beta-1,6-N-acetylglucosamine synthase-like glycosyltransferase
MWLLLLLTPFGPLALYGLHRLAHLALLLRREPEPPLGLQPEAELPTLLVQLPIYNERNVAARLIRAAGALDWPLERLTVQVLDDSDDETCAIVDQEAASLRAAGVSISVLRRTERSGFKAGALAAGLEDSDAELVAIFDADFVPRPDFARALVPYLDEPDVGMVQAAWGHLNRDVSPLTRAQATLLDGHFLVEHRVRHRAGLFFNFNGTAGIWRRAAIDGAGGWSDATLTEDLDLSYRAQLAGWRFAFAPDVVVPAELPVELAAFRSQQRRWAQGGVQVLRRLLGALLRARLTPAVRLEALAHLTSNVGYPLVLALAVLLPASLTFGRPLPQDLQLLVLLAGTLPVASFYLVGQCLAARPLRCSLVDVLLAMALGIGISWSQTRAVARGLFTRRGVFVRTPKQGDAGSPYVQRRVLPWGEAALALWMAWGIQCAAGQGLWWSIPLQVLFLAGFAWVTLLGVRGRTARALQERSALAVNEG